LRSAIGAAYGYDPLAHDQWLSDLRFYQADIRIMARGDEELIIEQPISRWAYSLSPISCPSSTGRSSA
jgi:hypothetical protein